MNKLLPLLALAASCAALAKIPAPVLDDAAKAKAAETAAKTAWQGKVDAYQLCKAQDKVAAYYLKTTGKAAPKQTKDTKPATPPVAAASGGTPVAAAPPAGCTEPGPFAYTPPDQKPLEASGAHSPPGTASSPPSTKTPSAATAPAKKT